MLYLYNCCGPQNNTVHNQGRERSRQKYIYKKYRGTQMTKERKSVKYPPNLSLFMWQTEAAEINIRKQESKQEILHILIINVCTSLMTEGFVIIVISLLIISSNIFSNLLKRFSVQSFQNAGTETGLRSCIINEPGVTPILANTLNMETLRGKTQVSKLRRDLFRAKGESWSEGQNKGSVSTAIFISLVELQYICIFSSAIPIIVTRNTRNRDSD